MFTVYACIPLTEFKMMWNNTMFDLITWIYRFHLISDPYWSVTDIITGPSEVTVTQLNSHICPLPHGSVNLILDYRLRIQPNIKPTQYFYCCWLFARQMCEVPDNV